jgi:hypothetical protein
MEPANVTHRAYGPQHSLGIACVEVPALRCAELAPNIDTKAGMTRKDGAKPS